MPKNILLVPAVVAMVFVAFLEFAATQPATYEVTRSTKIDGVHQGGVIDLRDQSRMHTYGFEPLIDRAPHRCVGSGEQERRPVERAWKPGAMSLGQLGLRQKGGSTLAEQVI